MTSLCWLDSIGLILTWLIGWSVRLVLPPMFLFILLIYLWHKEVEKDLTITQRKRLPPGHYGLPFLGETVQYVKAGREFTRTKIRQYGCIYKTHLLGSAIIRVAGSDAVKALLDCERECLVPYWPRSATQLLGPHALSSSSGQLHQWRRSALHKAFLSSSLTEYMPICRVLVRRQLQQWCQQDTVKVYDQCKELTFTIAANTLLGLRTVSAAQCKSLLTSFQQLEKNIFSIAMRLPWPFNGFSKGMKAREDICQQLRVILQEIKCQPNQLTGVLNALEGKNVWQNEEELIDCLIELLFAGHETMTITLTSLIGLLADAPVVVQRLLEEDALYVDVETEDWRTLTHRPYLSAVLKETLRLYPPVGAVFRKVVRSFTIQDFLIPQGWTVAYSIRDTIECSALFSDRPREFIPERWEGLEPSNTSKHYFPFGIGGRLCLGRQFAQMVLSVTVMELVRHCHWQLLNGSLCYGNDLVLKPHDGLPTKFIANNNSEICCGV